MEKDSVLDGVGLIFVMSNALGIKYQIVWFKYILHFPGNTTYVQTVCGRHRFGEKYQPDSRLAQDNLLVRLSKRLNLAGIQNRAAGYALQATWINSDHQETKDSILRKTDEG